MKLPLLNIQRLQVLTTILVAANALSIAYLPSLGVRITALCSVMLYVAIYIAYKGPQLSKFIFSVLLLFLSVDILNFFIDSPFITKGVYLVRITAYFLLAANIYNRVKLEIRQPIVFLVLVAVTVLNLHMMYSVLENAFETVEDIFEYGILIVYGITMISLVVMASNYCMRYDSSRSNCIVLGVIAIFLSDSAWFLASYLDYPSLFYFDVGFYMVGICYFIDSVFFTKESDDVLMARY